MHRHIFEGMKSTGASLLLVGGDGGVYDNDGWMVIVLYGKHKAGVEVLRGRTARGTARERRPQGGRQHGRQLNRHLTLNISIDTMQEETNGQRRVHRRRTKGEREDWIKGRTAHEMRQ